MPNENLDISSPESKDASANLAIIAKAMQKTFEESEASKKEMMDKVSKDLDVCLKANSDLQVKLSEQKAKQDEQEKVIQSFERFAAKNGSVKADNGEEIVNKDLYNAFSKMITCRNFNELKQTDEMFVKSLNRTANDQVYGFKYNPFTKQTTGERQLIESKYLRTDQADSGGLLIAPELSMQIMKRGTEYSPIRQYANVMQTYSNVLQFPVRNVLTSAYWEYEAADVSSDVSNSLYSREDIQMKRLSVQCVISLEDLQDSPFDMPSLISADVTEAFAAKEGAGFITGNGVKEVEGLLSNANVISTTSSKTGALAADDLMDMQAKIKWKIYGQNQYDRTFIMNKTTLIDVWKLKDGQGRYLWNEGSIANGIPSTIRGENYIVAPDMPDVATGAYPIIMGDLKRAFTIVDRMQMYMIRDELTFPGKVKFTFIRRLGAKVVMGEALVKLAIK